MSDDLFGQQPEGATPPTKRKYTPNGYAATPGTGPAGKTCADCIHLRRIRNYHGSKTFRKCALVRKNWTNSYGTDILARSPACAYFKAPEGGPF